MYLTAFYRDIVMRGFVDFQVDEIWNKILYESSPEGKVDLSETEFVHFDSFSQSTLLTEIDPSLSNMTQILSLGDILNYHFSGMFGKRARKFSLGTQKRLVLLHAQNVVR